jgi:hypothetical protein
MSLQQIHTDFEMELLEPTRVFEELATSKTFKNSNDFTTDELCLIEGVMSRIWQVWCRFCRRVVLESCQGTTELSGVPIPPLAAANSDGHVSAAAILAWRKRPVTWHQSNSVLRREPMWGDVDVLLDVIDGLKPNNAAKLKGMCTVSSTGAKLLQTARNAAAHHNHQSLGELLSLSSAFSAFPINHACQSAFWVETVSADYLLPFVLEELKDAAVYAVL